jgi:hypothetical protein
VKGDGRGALEMGDGRWEMGDGEVAAWPRWGASGLAWGKAAAGCSSPRGAFNVGIGVAGEVGMRVVERLGVEKLGRGMVFCS